MPIHALSLELVEEIRASYPALASIDLARNCISRIENLHPLATLTRVDLTDNCITILENIHTLPRLEHLIVADNAIARINTPPTPLLRLSLLDLARNAITSIDVLRALAAERAPALRHVDIQGNPVAEVLGEPPLQLSNVLTQLALPPNAPCEDEAYLTEHLARECTTTTTTTTQLPALASVPPPPLHQPFTPVKAELDASQRRAIRDAADSLISAVGQKEADAFNATRRCDAALSRLASSFQKAVHRAVSSRASVETRAQLATENCADAQKRANALSEELVQTRERAIAAETERERAAAETAAKQAELDRIVANVSEMEVRLTRAAEETSAKQAELDLIVANSSQMKIQLEHASAEASTKQAELERVSLSASNVERSAQAQANAAIQEASETQAAAVSAIHAAKRESEEAMATTRECATVLQDIRHEADTAVETARRNANEAIEEARRDANVAISAAKRETSLFAVRTRDEVTSTLATARRREAAASDKVRLCEMLESELRQYMEELKAHAETHAINGTAGCKRPRVASPKDGASSPLQGSALSPARNSPNAEMMFRGLSSFESALAAERMAALEEELQQTRDELASTQESLQKLTAATTSSRDEHVQYALTTAAELEKARKEVEEASDSAAAAQEKLAAVEAERLEAVSSQLELTQKLKSMQTSMHDMEGVRDAAMQRAEAAEQAYEKSCEEILKLRAELEKEHEQTKTGCRLAEEAASALASADERITLITDERDSNAAALSAEREAHQNSKRDLDCATRRAEESAEMLRVRDQEIREVAASRASASAALEIAQKQLSAAHAQSRADTDALEQLHAASAAAAARADAAEAASAQMQVALGDAQAALTAERRGRASAETARAEHVRRMDAEARRQLEAAQLAAHDAAQRAARADAECETCRGVIASLTAHLGERVASMLPHPLSDSVKAAGEIEALRARCAALEKIPELHPNDNNETAESETRKLRERLFQALVHVELERSEAQRCAATVVSLRNKTREASARVRAVVEETLAERDARDRAETALGECREQLQRMEREAVEFRGAASHLASFASGATALICGDPSISSGGKNAVAALSAVPNLGIVADTLKSRIPEMVERLSALEGRLAQVKEANASTLAEKVHAEKQVTSAAIAIETMQAQHEMRRASELEAASVAREAALRAQSQGYDDSLDAAREREEALQAQLVEAGNARELAMQAHAKEVEAIKSRLRREAERLAAEAAADSRAEASEEASSLRSQIASLSREANKSAISQRALERELQKRHDRSAAVASNRIAELEQQLSRRGEAIQRMRKERWTAIRAASVVQPPSPEKVATKQPAELLSESKANVKPAEGDLQSRIAKVKANKAPPPMPKVERKPEMKAPFSRDLLHSPPTPPRSPEHGTDLRARLLDLKALGESLLVA